MIIKQGGIAAEMECIRSSDDELNIHDVDQSLQKTIRNIRNYVDKNSQPGSIEIRAIDYLPPWSIMAFNPLSEDGVMYVSLLTFKTDAEKRPSFVLHASEDGVWMKNFTDQFNAAWEVAEKINVSKLN